MGEVETVGNGDTMGEGEAVSDGNPVGDSDGDAVGEGDVEPLGEGDAEPVGEGDAVGDDDRVGTGRALAAARPVPKTATKMPVATAHPPAVTAAAATGPADAWEHGHSTAGWRPRGRQLPEAS
jgi:hypothetical protein